MTRRVHERRGPATAPQEKSEPDDPMPMHQLRVAGAVTDRDAVEVEQIAGVLEVATWIKRLRRRT